MHNMENTVSDVGGGTPTPEGSTTPEDTVVSQC